MESKAIEEIAAAIAHEVKNPLTMVRFNLDILESSDKRLETHKNYSMIRKELKKINDIMMDFIYLTGTCYGKRDVVHIESLLDELKEDLQVAMPDIRINITYPQVNLTITGYESALRILFGNIVKNAVEAMDFAGELQITAEKEGGVVKLKFKDSGPGLSKEVAQKMFKEQITTKPMGSGLGLAICKKIAKEHGGDFLLKNDPNGGCSASVELKEAAKSSV